MDILSLLEQYSARLNAGAVGSLIAVLTAKQDASVSVYTRLFCGWSVAVFGTPLALGVVTSVDATRGYFERLHQRGEAETVVAFLVGLTGWHIIDFVNKNAKRLSKRRVGDD